jgi:outer membrane protein assembly factor BamA
VPNLNKAQTIGINFATTLFQNREITYATVNNERLFFNLPDGNARETTRHRAAIVYRPNFYVFHRLDISYQRTFTPDTVQTFAPDFFNNGTNRLAFFAAQYDFIFDNRDYRYYPLKGLFFGVNLRQEGLGIVNNEMFITTVYPFYKQFFKISDRVFYGHSARGKYSFTEDIPYFRQMGLGFGEEVVRGYQYYVVDGQHYFLTKQNIKFMLVKPKKYKFKLTGVSQFDKFHFALYLNIFYDSGYVWDNIYAMQNPLSNRYLYSTGVGLDLVAYYDSVLRLEVALNRERETGFFISFAQAL